MKHPSERLDLIALQCAVLYLAVKLSGVEVSLSIIDVDVKKLRFLIVNYLKLT